MRARHFRQLGDAADPEDRAALEEVIHLLTYAPDRSEAAFERVVLAVGARIEAGHPSAEPWRTILFKVIDSWRNDIDAAKEQAKRFRFAKPTR